MTLIEQSIKEAQEDVCVDDGTLYDDYGTRTFLPSAHVEDVKELIATHMHKLAKELREATQVEEKEYVGEETAQIQTGQVWLNKAYTGYNQCRTDINNKWDGIH